MQYPKDFQKLTLDVIIAANRFGFGMRPGEDAIIAKGPRKWLHEQVDHFMRSRPRPSFRSGTLITAAMLAHIQGNAGFKAHIIRMSAIAHERASSHTLQLLKSDLPFMDRWIDFWVEYFGLSQKDQRMLGLQDALIDEVIRPFCLAPYRVLLTEMVKHPAFLIFLGNSNAVGPSNAFPLPQTHLLAQTILKHLTLGEFGPYHDGDINALAQILRPYQIRGPQDASSGQFFYDQARAQPTATLFLNRIFPKAAALQGEAALEMLTHHPETASTLAIRMARHFISDSPSEALISDLQNAYANSGGSLHAMAKALIDSDESWYFSNQKVKTPKDLTISTLRALGLDDIKSANFALLGQTAMGQTPLEPPLLAQWPVGMNSWLKPHQIEARIGWQAEVLGWLPNLQFSASAAFALLGPNVNETLFRRLLVSRSGVEQALLTLTSPAFQWR